MADSRTGTGNKQEKPEASCHIDGEEVIEDKEGCCKRAFEPTEGGSGWPKR